MRRWFPLFGNIEVQLPRFFPAKPRETDRDTETAKNLSSNLLLIDLFNKINNLRKLKAKRKLPISEASLVRMVRQAGFEPTTLVRSQVLYPTELLAHISDISASLFCEAGRIVSPGFDLCKSFLKISCKKLKLPQNSRRIGDPRILRQSRRQLC